MKESREEERERDRRGGVKKEIEMKEDKMTKKKEETRAVSDKSVNFYIISGRIYGTH